MQLTDNVIKRPIFIGVNQIPTLTDRKIIKAIEDALDAANGKAYAHTYNVARSITGLCAEAESRLATLCLPISIRSGACFQATSGDRIPQYYKYPRKATSVKMRRTHTHWIVYDVRSEKIYKGGGRKLLSVTKHQNREILARIQTTYDVR